jgi:hypothetical protein
MLESLIDIIFVIFSGRVFQQSVGIPMGTYCAPLLAGLFLHSYEADVIQELLKKNEKKLARLFNFTRCCWNVATYEWNVQNGKIEIISFVAIFRS